MEQISEQLLNNSHGLGTKNVLWDGGDNLFFFSTDYPVPYNMPHPITINNFRSLEPVTNTIQCTSSTTPYLFHIKE